MDHTQRPVNQASAHTGALPVSGRGPQNGLAKWAAEPALTRLKISLLLWLSGLALMSLGSISAGPVSLVVLWLMIAVTGWMWGKYLGASGALLLYLGGAVWSWQMGWALNPAHGFAFLGGAAGLFAAMLLGGFAGHVRDLDIRHKETEQAQLDKSLHDDLTGLPNRALLRERLDFLLKRREREPGLSFAVLVLDLDRLGTINESFGHEAGDRLLRACSRRLREATRASDTLARFAGGKFILLLESPGDVTTATRVAERINGAFKLPLRLDGREIHASMSIGIAWGDERYTNPDEVLRDAELAMHRAKERGKGNHEIFDREMHDKVLHTLQLEGDLRRAIKEGELLLHYQPIVSLSDGSLIGFEALVRWQHPTKGMISPMAFIPIAETTGQIIPLGAWVLREACRQLSEWQEEHPSARELSMSVNLSTRQFQQSDLGQQIQAILEETKLPPACLRLELTETAMMEQADKAIPIIQHLKSLGIQIYMDDFGTGYSSLSYLHKFPLDTLKVDCSFIRDMDTNQDTTIVETIIKLAQHLDLNVIAEGIETTGHVEILRQMGCLLGQGYLFSKPLPHEKIVALIKEAHTWSHLTAPSPKVSEEATTEDATPQPPSTTTPSALVA